MQKLPVVSGHEVIKALTRLGERSADNTLQRDIKEI